MELGSLVVSTSSTNPNSINQQICDAVGWKKGENIIKLKIIYTTLILLPSPQTSAITILFLIACLYQISAIRMALVSLTQRQAYRLKLEASEENAG